MACDVSGAEAVAGLGDGNGVASPNGSAKRRAATTSALARYDTPSPQDYATLLSDGKSHKFGRIDQVSAPKFTIRAKTVFGNTKPSGTEPSGPLADKVDAVLTRPPSWTMAPRASGIPPAPEQPGPGEYRIPSTLYGSHPQLTCAGRVPTRTAKRPEQGHTGTPSPQDYDTLRSSGKAHKFGRVDQLTAPTYTMRQKTTFGAYKPSGTEPSGPLSEKYNAILRKSPSWSMAPRAAGIPKPPEQPGPGEYKIPSTLYGSHPQLTCAGRVPRLTEQRPAQGPRPG
eukprot:TRINITY_DN60885_c0_g1_i1.p1 TRINITY_DN60885_c0_g1~~TRINITY_DN60885_c0_g1_i1.p1  ORF type:complete len:291 (-),score=31.25 TRINITY_DN60885_c0_g1_i1:68-916(-)